MKRTHPQRRGLARDQMLEPLAHLARGLVGERDREHPPRGDQALLDQMRHALRDDPGLAAARAREHHERTISVHDRSLLLGVQ
jgi:hypothetical protein